VITIFGTTYFTIGAGLVVLVLAAPLLFWFSRWLWRPNVEDKPWRVQWLAIGGTTLGLLLLVAVGLFWDVYLIGQRAKELCQETGLVVMKRVSPAGILGLTHIQGYDETPLPFVESEFQGKRYRYTLNQRKVEKIEIREFQSEYQLDRLTEQQSSDSVIDKSFVNHLEVISHRKTGDIFGQLKSIAIDAGWFDRLFFSVSGFVYRPWVCGKTLEGAIAVGNDRMTHRDLVNAVIKSSINPRTDEHGHQQLLPERLVR
jgi:hypothetical protein